MNRSHQTEASPTSIHASSGGRRNLVLIDGDTVFAPVLAEAPGSQGLDVSLFADGDDFLTHPAAFDFDYHRGST